MQLSLYSDYSLRVLIFLAIRAPERASIEEIAKAYGISTNHLVKVVHNLAKLGYVTTSRGRGGGVWLAREPETIAIGEVVRATEPRLDLVECFNLATNTCPIVPGCGLKAVIALGLEAFLKTLDQYTLRDALRAPATLKKIFEERLTVDAVPS